MTRAINLTVVVHDDTNVHGRFDSQINITPPPPAGVETLSTQMAAELVGCVERFVSKHSEGAKDAG